MQHFVMQISSFSSLLWRAHRQKPFVPIAPLLGDLAGRFPNLLEPWTENVYARLRDASISVRKNAVLVLSHLILNDTMKVKGYINVMAMRLEDEDERISNLAKLFFHELSKKGHNPIYNLLPDILGNLSNENLKRESFCNVMQFLIGSIKRDKQLEALVVKLCNRFCGVTDGRQWEKLVKFHIEKEEQEMTAQNALTHQQKLSSLENFVVAKNGEESAESEISEVIAAIVQTYVESEIILQHVGSPHGLGIRYGFNMCILSPRNHSKVVWMFALI